VQGIAEKGHPDDLASNIDWLQFRTSPLSRQALSSQQV
jgi:hypothetical protein